MVWLFVSRPFDSQEQKNKNKRAFWRNRNRSAEHRRSSRLRVTLSPNVEPNKSCSRTKRIPKNGGSCLTLLPPSPCPPLLKMKYKSLILRIPLSISLFTGHTECGAVPGQRCGTVRGADKIIGQRLPQKGDHPEEATNQNAQHSSHTGNHNETEQTTSQNLQQDICNSSNDNNNNSNH